MKAFEQFRKSFPAAVDASTLKKFNIAPANESYVINTFRFLRLIDDDGKKVDDAVSFFFGGAEQFAAGMTAAIRDAYTPLFEDHGDEAWERSREELSTWFRVTDKTSDLVGGRQAATFLTLSGLAGHGDTPKPTQSTGKTPVSPKTKKAAAAGTTASTSPTPDPALANAPTVSLGSGGTPAMDLGLTVRIEVNLPAGASADDYDAIFSSIRKNLIDRG